MPATVTPKEHPEFLSRQLITYLGNKRNLLGPIQRAVETARERSGGRRLRVLDAFAGSGVVSRMLKAHAAELVVNDLEAYARVIAECYLRNRETVDFDDLQERIAAINAEVDETRDEAGLFRHLYAPRDAAAITKTDRVFYTPQNASRLDGYRRLIGQHPEELQSLLLGPLLSQASIHANTAGVFKGFYKDRHTGVGRLGGTGGDALARITATIALEVPVLSYFDCAYEIHQRDANELARELDPVDLAYLDPPYNQHPYGSNYFMLNLLVSYEEPRALSRVSGIPADWRRSDYNVRALALPRFQELIETLQAEFLVVSHNDEGFISAAEMRRLLESVGTVSEERVPHATFRGARNLAARRLHVTEHVYLVHRS